MIICKSCFICSYVHAELAYALYAYPQIQLLQQVSSNTPYSDCYAAKTNLLLYALQNGKDSDGRIG